MIDSYKMGSIVIDGSNYGRDVVVFPGRVKTDWYRRKGHELATKDIVDILGEKPEIFVVGVGMEARLRILDETKSWLGERGIQLVAQKTDEAVFTYNKLLREGRKVVAALHINC